mgnify:CR=1 FL=1
MEQTNVQNNVKAREANMELLRIVAMLMVITLHCVGRGLLLSNPVISNVNLLLIQFLDSFSLTANSLFILLTGYYYIGKKFNLRKILSLWGKTLFYCILIFTIYSILNLKTNFLNSFFPVFSGAYWFITSYIALYFIMPFLNIAINKFSQKQCKFLIIFLVILMGVIRIIFNPADLFNSTFMHMIVIYIIGAYIKKYVKIEPNKQYFIKYVLVAIIFTVAITILNVLVRIVPKTLDVWIIIANILSYFRIFINIILVYMAILLFMKFKTINIKSNKLSKLILYISPSVFSIYIIHDNVHLRDMIWQKFGFINLANSWLMIPYIILAILIVFTVCLAIDLIRRGIYTWLKKIKIINKGIQKINEQIDKVNTKINCIFETEV